MTETGAIEKVLFRNRKFALNYDATMIDEG